MSNRVMVQVACHDDYYGHLPRVAKSLLRILNKVAKLDTAVIFLVSFITLKDDLAKAVVGNVTSKLLRRDLSL